MRSVDRRSTAGIPRSEILIAVGALVLAEIEVWSAAARDVGGSRPVAALAVAAMALALLGGSRAPLPALVLTCFVFVAWTLVAAPAGPFVPLLIVLGVVFRLAAHSTTRVALLGAAAGLGVLWLDIALTLSGFANYIFVGAFVVASCAAGLLLHGRESRAMRMETRATLAERDRDARAREAVIEERERIARELHDIVAHTVGVMVIQAQAAQSNTDLPAGTARALAEIESSGQRALVELRRLLGLLRRGDQEAALAPQPGLRQLDELIGSVCGAGLPVAVDIVGEPVMLPPGIDLSAYRIVQEALTNTLKHAGAARARVVLTYTPRALDIEVTDDGSGAMADEDGGHGLPGMRERVSVYGGSLATGNQPGGGYAVHAQLPIEQVLS